MVAQDRALLARLRTMNAEIGRFTIEILHKQDGGELPTEGLRLLAEHLTALAVDMADRAEELDGRVIEQERS